MATLARVWESFHRNVESTLEMSQLVEAVFGPDNPNDRKKRLAAMFLTAAEGTWKEERAGFYDNEEKERVHSFSSKGGKNAGPTKRDRADREWRNDAKRLMGEIEGERTRPLSASALATEIMGRWPPKNDNCPTHGTIRKMIGTMRGRKKRWSHSHYVANESG